MTQAATFSIFFCILIVTSYCIGWVSCNEQLLGKNLQQSCQCHDVSPADDFSCAQQVAWGKCMKEWMILEGFCHKSCGFCTCQGECTCMDIPPDSLYTCTQQKSYGKCDAEWMIQGHFCSFTCGRCICSQLYQQQQYQQQPLSYQYMPKIHVSIKSPDTAQLHEMVPENFDDQFQILPYPEEEEFEEGDQSVILTNSDYQLLEQVTQQQNSVSQVNYLMSEAAPILLPNLQPQVEQEAIQIASSDEQDGCVSLAEEVSQMEDLETIGGFLRAADIQHQLNESSECTLFLPSNEALDQFLTLLHLSAAELIVATTVLQAYLQYHIIPDTAYPLQKLTQTPKIYTLLPDSPPLQTQLSSASLKIISPAIEAEIIQSDIQLQSCFSNCIIHKINRVLSPVPFVSKNIPFQEKQEDYSVQQVAQTQILYENSFQQPQYEYLGQELSQLSQQQQNSSNPLQWQQQQSQQSAQFWNQQQQYLQQQQLQQQQASQQQYQQLLEQQQQSQYLQQNTMYNLQQQQQQQLSEQLLYSIDVREGESQPYFRTSEFASSDLQSVQQKQVECDEGSRVDLLQGMGEQVKGLVSLMYSSTFVEFVEGVEGDLTILVPINAAFEQLANILGLDGLQGVMSLDYQILRELMATHLVSRKLGKSDLEQVANLTSTAGATISLQRLNGYSQNLQLQLTAPGSVARIVNATAGVSCDTWIHLIDNVLIPYPESIQGLKDRISQTQQEFLAAAVFDPGPLQIQEAPFLIPMQHIIFPPPPPTPLYNPHSIEKQIELWKNLHIQVTTGIDPSELLAPTRENFNQNKFEYELQNSNREQNLLLLEEDDGFIQIEQQQWSQNLQLDECDSIMTILSEREDLQFMAHALQDAGMGEIIDNKNSLLFTVFAVQNDFFRKMIFEMDDRIANLLSKNQSMQQALMGYMVVQGTYSANDLSNKDQEFLNTLTFNLKNNSALQLFVESMGGENTIVLSGADQNAVVIERDIYACNGIIHVISHGLSPIKIGTANDQLSANQFSTSEIPQQNVTYVPLLQSNVSQTMQNIANLLSDQIKAPSDAQNVPIQYRKAKQTQCCKLLNLLENISATSWFAILVRESGWDKKLTMENHTAHHLFVPLNKAFGTLDEQVGLGIATLLQQHDLSKELLDYHFASFSSVSDEPIFSSDKNFEQILRGSNTTSIQMTTWLQKQQISLKLLEEQKNQNKQLDSEVWGEVANIMQLNPVIDFGSPRRLPVEVVDGLGASSQLLVSNLKTCEATVHFIDRVLLPQF